MNFISNISKMKKMKIVVLNGSPKGNMSFLDSYSNFRTVLIALFHLLRFWERYDSVLEGENIL